MMQKFNKKVRNSKPVKHPMKPSEKNHAILQAELESILRSCNEMRAKYLKLAEDAQKFIKMYESQIKKLNKKLGYATYAGMEPSDPRYFLHARKTVCEDIKDLYMGLASDFEYKPANPSKKHSYATFPELSNLGSTCPWDFWAFDVLANTLIEEKRFSKVPR